MSDDLVLEVTKIGAFKFFTVDSNILVGITSLIMAILEYQIINNKRKKVFDKLYVMKYISVVGVTLTFLVTTFYLAPYSPKGFFSMFQNSNLFFHLIVPILSLISFIFFEKTDKIKFKHTFLGLIPVLIYAIFYVFNVFIHLENGEVSVLYDWYGFAQGSLKTTIFVFIFMHAITYIICLLIWFFNKRRKIKNYS